MIFPVFKTTYGLYRTHIFKKFGSEVEKLALQKPARIKRKTLEFNYTVKVENLSLNGGRSEESAETLVELGDYLDDFYKKLFGGPGQNDSMIYSKGSMDTMKMAGLSKF